jgi:catechol 2,3-dioxygenase-like lactoylglutathione lyase family enzyme
MVSIGHIALFVHDLQGAETFYQIVFGMKHLMRETELDDHLWYTLPPDKGWDDALAAGITLSMVALKRDDFILALFQGNPVPEETVLEIGINMAAGEIASVHDRLPDTVEIVNHEYGDLMFDDPFGYRWHIWPAGKEFRSNGESSGRWLAL